MRRNRTGPAFAAVIAGLVAGLVLGFTAPAAEREPLEWQVHTSLLTHHWDDDPEYTEHQHLLAIQAARDDGWLGGLALFRNSWDQPTQYLFLGRRWRLGSSDRFFVKLTGGLLHGYDGDYQDRIPLNDLGVAPAILPSVGFQHRWFVLEIQLAAASAVMVTAGIRFPRGRPREEEPVTYRAHRSDSGETRAAPGAAAPAPREHAPL